MNRNDVIKWLERYKQREQKKSDYWNTHAPTAANMIAALKEGKKQLKRYGYYLTADGFANFVI